MRILQLINKVPHPPKDGGTIAIRSLSDNFIKHGVDVKMLAMNTRKHFIRREDIPDGLLRKTAMEIVEVDAYPTPFGALANFLFSRTPYTASRFMDSAYEKALTRLLQNETFDIVQLEGVYMAAYIPLIRQYSKAKIAIRAHNIEYEIWKRIAENATNFWKRYYFRSLSNRVKRFEQHYFPLADLILAITQRDAKHLKSLNIDTPAVVVPAGIDIDKLPAGKTAAEFPDLFHLGALDWEPNLEGLRWFLKDIWPDIMLRTPDLRLHIAGRNASARTEKFLRQQPNVVYHGEVKDAYQFMNEHTIMIVPLLSGGGMRIKILEGMALGKAIVSTPVGAEGMDYSGGEEILIAATANDFVRQITAIAGDKGRCMKIGEKAKKLILEKYDNFAIVKRLITQYEKLI